MLLLRSFSLRANLTVALFCGAMSVLVDTGCGTSGASLCKTICDCEGCSDSALQECIDSAEVDAKRAGDLGCPALYDEWAACSADHLACNGAKIKAEGCESELKKLSNCVSPVSNSGSGGSGSGGSGVGGFGGGSTGNVGACNDWVDQTMCGSTDISTLVDCNLYEDVQCDISDYFDCLLANTQCDNGVLDATGWGDCANEAVCE